MYRGPILVLRSINEQAQNSGLDRSDEVISASMVFCASYNIWPLTFVVFCGILLLCSRNAKSQRYYKPTGVRQAARAVRREFLSMALLIRLFKAT